MIDPWCLLTTKLKKDPLVILKGQGNFFNYINPPLVTVDFPSVDIDACAGLICTIS